ncbi:MAG: hypothetical protein QMD95_01655 [Candidatus Hodarchaeaceae archaeon]|nr:hypothetical protein [Candidatus Hodarchaeaceae archaeon]
MIQVLLWLLPIVDVFTLQRILKYYRSLGVRVPWGHAKAGLVERWVGYLPAGFIIGRFAGFILALLLMLAVLAVLGPIELWLMIKGVRPWKFFRGKDPIFVAKIFLLEGYNAVGYFLLGAALGALST